MTEEKYKKLYVELEEEEQKVEIEYCKMFNSTPDEIPLNQMVRFRSGYCMGKHYGYLAGLHEGQKETDYAKSIIKSLLDNSDEYAEQRARDFLKE